MKRSIFWGLTFIGIAVLIIVNSLGLLQGLGFWTVLLTVVFAVTLIEGIMDLQVANTIFSGAFLYIIWDKPLGLPIIPIWSLLIAALFATIGLDLLMKRMRIEKFKKKHVDEFKKHMDYFEQDVENFGRHFDRFNKRAANSRANVEYDSGEYIMCMSKYSGMKKYITSQNLKSIRVDVSFGSGEIYLDQANAPEGIVDMDIDCSFGSVRIYIPRSWNFEDNINNTMAGVSVIGSPDGQNLVTVKASGVVNAGSVDIRYI